jgi:hypothetical protein
VSSYIDIDALIRIVASSFGFGLAGITAYSLVVLGVDRATEPSRDPARHAAVATAGWIVAAFGAAVCIAAVAAGLYAMTNK